MPEAKAKRISSVQHGPPVVLQVNGRDVQAYRGEMLAAVLMAAGIYRLRHSPHGGAPRGAFCLMGVCQECVVKVHGKLAQSCMVAVDDGLNVELLSATVDLP